MLRTSLNTFESTGQSRAEQISLVTDFEQYFSNIDTQNSRFISVFEHQEENTKFKLILKVIWYWLSFQIFKMLSIIVVMVCCLGCELWQLSIVEINSFVRTSSFSFSLPRGHSNWGINKYRLLVQNYFSCCCVFNLSFCFSKNRVVINSLVTVSTVVGRNKTSCCYDNSKT